MEKVSSTEMLNKLIEAIKGGMSTTPIQTSFINFLKMVYLVDDPKEAMFGTGQYTQLLNAYFGGAMTIYSLMNLIAAIEDDEKFQEIVLGQIDDELRNHHSNFMKAMMGDLMTMPASTDN